MNHNIRRLAALFTVAFLLLIGYLTYWQVVAADELANKMPYNAARQQAQEELVTRGSILDRNGQRLAWTEKTPQGQSRVYADPALVHVLGYHSFRYGETNIEAAFNSYLSGDKGLDPLALLRKEFLHQNVAGADVVTTIDLDLQKVADDALGDWPGAIVALDPHTGEILALASHPYFDPNRIDEIWPRISQAASQPLVNRAAAGQYPPGSTFKTVTLATALDGAVISQDTTFTNKGDLVVDGFHIKYTNPPDRPTFPVRDAYAFSVNAAFADVGLKLGAERLVQGAARFGFGEAPPLPGIPTAVSTVSTTAGFLQSRPALASTAFGQGELQVTPLEMALTLAAVANNGAIEAPYVVSQVRDQNGTVYYQNSARVWKQAMSQSTAAFITQAGVVSVEQGFAQAAQIPGVKVAGKTGTAEVGGTAEPHAWFIGFAPVDNPSIVVAVVRENAGQGSGGATPQAAKVLRAWLANHQP
ncbi:MAG: penicillin-binding protein 2 [Chloroflexi bacterium]|nr:penicillin-binding protein 2 [Chloroflexota bacterium]